MVKIGAVVIGDRRVLAIVPARGGSKGIHLKNIHPFLGKPLIAHVGDVIREVPEIDRCVVSTDHDEIASVAEAAGLEAPFRRPESLSGDRIADYDVLSHALEEMERQDECRYDLVVMLQPTSPLRRPVHVSEAIQLLHREGFDSVWSISETDSKGHPFKQLKVQDGHIDYYDEAGKKIIARQQLQPVYHRNGVVYVITRECLKDYGDITGKKCGSYIIDEYLVSIDTQWDLEWAEYVAQKRK